MLLASVPDGRPGPVVLSIAARFAQAAENEIMFFAWCAGSSSEGPDRGDSLRVEAISGSSSKPCSGPLGFDRKSGVEVRVRYSSSAKISPPCLSGALDSHCIPPPRVDPVRSGWIVHFTMKRWRGGGGCSVPEPSHPIIAHEVR